MYVLNLEFLKGWGKIFLWEGILDIFLDNSEYFIIMVYKFDLD